MYSHITPWNLLSKQQIWKQLKFIYGQRVLDFGSGEGITANYLAEHNTVVAVEPNAGMLLNRLRFYPYDQIEGGIEAIMAMPDESFDAITCHNVLEYIDDRAFVYREFERLLKPGGILSLVKHNRTGRIMQMVVLLNNFEHAQELLDGQNGNAQQFGTIGYYDDDELLKYASSFTIENIYGVRTFWHLQQNQDNHIDAVWQQKMLEMETRVEQVNEFLDIAFFHHLIVRKNSFSKVCNSL